MGKGAWRRPLLVSQKEYSDNWDRIFNQKKKKAKKVEEKENEKQDTNVRADSSTDE